MAQDTLGWGRVLKIYQAHLLALRYQIFLGAPTPHFPPTQHHHKILGSLEKVLLKLGFCAYKIRIEVSKGLPAPESGGGDGGEP